MGSFFVSFRRVLDCSVVALVVCCDAVVIRLYSLSGGPLLSSNGKGGGPWRPKGPWGEI